MRARRGSRYHCPSAVFAAHTFRECSMHCDTFTKGLTDLQADELPRHAVLCPCLLPQRLQCRVQVH